MSAAMVAGLLGSGYLLGRTRPWQALSSWNARALTLSRPASRQRRWHAALFTVLHPVTAVSVARQPPPQPYAVTLPSPARGLP